MSHHGDKPFDPEALKVFQDAAERAGLGPTGEFPDGKLTPEDEGELKFAICVKDGKVVFEFGAPVAWVGFTPKQAREIAASIKAAADYISLPKTVVVVPG